MQYCLNCGKSFKKWGNLKKCCSKPCTDAYWVKTHKEMRRKNWQKYNEIHAEQMRQKSINNYIKHKDQYISYRKEHRLQNNARTRAKYAMQKSGILKICSDCGIDIKIHVHHIDHNAFNNNLTNLVYLCTACHGLRHRN